jgi:hypothetical protein
VLKNLLKIFVFEAEKKEDYNNKNKFLINQLAKTIVENFKILSEFDIVLPIIVKIKHMILLDVSAMSKNDKKFTS